jgi:hypothetical protein
MDKKIIGIIGVIAVVCIIIALFFTGIIHTGAFAMSGTTYGPGTYVIGTDLPAGVYDFEEPYSLEGGATFHASSLTGISNEGVRIDSGAVVTIHEGGSMTYRGS